MIVAVEKRVKNLSVVEKEHSKFSVTPLTVFSLMATMTFSKNSFHTYSDSSQRVVITNYFLP